MSDALVWYLAYGSNLAADRFAVYLRGGTPVGGRRVYPGTRDRTPPRDDRPVVLDRPLYFAGASRTWGGGVAFVDPAPDPEARTLARAWLVTVGQLEDIVAQEREAAWSAINVEELVRRGHAALGGSKYGTLVACPALDGIPAVTCTAPPPGPEGPVAAPPALPYLRHIASGLAEAHGLCAAEAATYLADCPGVCDAWDARTLADGLAEAEVR